jgi:hypothetical protein
MVNEKKKKIGVLHFGKHFSTFPDLNCKKQVDAFLVGN